MTGFWAWFSRGLQKAQTQYNNLCRCEYQQMIESGHSAQLGHVVIDNFLDCVFNMQTMETIYQVM